MSLFTWMCWAERNVNVKETAAVACRIELNKVFRGHCDVIIWHALIENKQVDKLPQIFTTFLNNSFLYQKVLSAIAKLEFDSYIWKRVYFIWYWGSCLCSQHKGKQRNSTRTQHSDCLSVYRKKVEIFLHAVFLLPLWQLTKLKKKRG